MIAYLRREHLPATLGQIGGLLGMIAGAVQASIGSTIPAWTGSKSNPVGLGLLTMALSGVAVVAACRLDHDRLLSPGQRVTVIIAMLVPGTLCFTTVGALVPPRRASPPPQSLACRAIHEAHCAF